MNSQDLELELSQEQFERIINKMDTLSDKVDRFHATLIRQMDELKAEIELNF